jgi:hypothetical protein
VANRPEPDTGANATASAGALGERNGESERPPSSVAHAPASSRYSSFRRRAAIKIRSLTTRIIDTPQRAWVCQTWARKRRVENGLTPTEVMTGFCSSTPATQRGPYPQPGLNHDCDYLSITASTGTPIWVAMGV